MPKKPKKGKDTDVTVNPPEQNRRLYVVGIGASAGGLEAMRELLGALDFNPRLTYIVTQHLSPTHISMLKNLLARECTLNVVDLVDGQVPEADSIYITPPNTDVESRNGVIHLLKPKSGIGPKPRIDRFFASLAEDLGEYAIGIILSGTGADGARGLLSIKSAGGTTLVQDPATAKYNGMPRAAVQTNSADLILPAAKMGEVLASFVSVGDLRLDKSADESNDAYDRIITLTRETTGFNLTQYKRSTVERRIRRRMALYHQTRLEEYLEFMRTNSDEVEHFAKDVLISVTEFFRDPDAFAVLGQEIKTLVATAPDSHTLRAWVPGCATGEEAYSIAILFEEAMRNLGRRRNYQVFATDIDSSATARGRLARYPDSAFEKMNPDWLERYFERTGGEFMATKSLREHIVFSLHNLIQDPPFSRVDLISCRNLLIYFTTPLQKRVMEIFHYSLNPNGLLFLGKSETVGQHEDLFAAVAKPTRLYRKLGDRRIYRPFAIPQEFQTDTVNAQKLPRRNEIDPIEFRVSQALQKAYAPPSIVITTNDEIIHAVGDTSPFLQIQSGPVGLSVYDLIKEHLRAELRALVYKSRREGGVAQGGRHESLREGGSAIRMTVRPLEDHAGGLLLVGFEPIGERSLPSDMAQTEVSELEHPIILELEHELATTREHLQTVVEELETSNEELQSVNEELQSANEELQSTNEELQTSNEELQSTNEELLTVNDELQVKSRELEILANDLQNIQDNMDFPLLLVDKNLRVTRFARAVDQIIPSKEIHHGDLVTQLPWNVDIPHLRQVINKVTKTQKTHSEIVQSKNRFFQLRVIPYRENADHVAGALLLFPETTELHTAKINLQVSEQRLQSLIDNIVDGIIAINDKGRILSYNQSAEKIFGYTANEVIGQNISMLMPAHLGAEHDRHLNKYLRTGKSTAIGVRREQIGLRKDGSEFPMELSINEMMEGDNRVFTGLVRDLSERKQLDAKLFNETQRALVTLHSIGEGVITTDNKGNINFINRIGQDLLGYTNDEAFGRPLHDIFRIIDKSTREVEPNPALVVLNTGRILVHNDGSETLLRSKNGHEYTIDHNAAPIMDDGGAMTGVVVVFRDVTEKVQILNQMVWQARHDSLTGLINRKEMEERLEHALTSAKSFQRSHGFLFIDLDQFKIVNDTCGHQAGDELLRQIAGHLGANLRARDTLSRLGGDEFGVLLENCTISQAQQIAGAIRETVEDYRFIWEDKVFKIGASIGVVSIDETSVSLAQILSDADAACYAAKDAGRNRVQLHNSEDAGLALRRREMHWVANINQFLDENRFRLYFQRIQPLHGAHPVHWEVLLRLIDDDKKVILPGVFIPAMERYGLMQKIDRWVLRTTLNTLAKTPRTPIESQARVSVNISGSSLSDEKFSTFVLQQFNSIPVPASQVCFEITETAAIANYGKAREFIRDMKSLGCRFALDDFGSGMSSFGYLKSLQVDYIKIDGSFVRNLNHDMIDLAMVESINRIGHIMDIDTIAEFVETDDVLEKLRQIGVNYAQGFGIQRPISSEEFLDCVI